MWRIDRVRRELSWVKRIIGRDTSILYTKKDSTNNLEIYSEEAVTLLVEKDEYDDIN
mgnify:CR=1 FL=1